MVHHALNHISQIVKTWKTGTTPLAYIDKVYGSVLPVSKGDGSNIKIAWSDYAPNCDLPPEMELDRGETSLIWFEVVSDHSDSTDGLNGVVRMFFHADSRKLETTTAQGDMVSTMSMQIERELMLKIPSIKTGSVPNFNVISVGRVKPILEPWNVLRYNWSDKVTWFRHPYIFLGFEFKISFNLPCEFDPITVKAC